MPISEVESLSSLFSDTRNIPYLFVAYCCIIRFLMKFDAFSGVVMDVRPQELMKSSVFHSWTKNSACFSLTGSKGIMRSRGVEMLKSGGKLNVDSEAMMIGSDIKQRSFIFIFFIPTVKILQGF